MSAAGSVSTRTRHRSSAPLLTLSTTLTHPSRIGKSRTPKSAFPRSAASLAPSSASLRSAISLASASSLASANTAASSPCSPYSLAKAIAAVATTPVSAVSWEGGSLFESRAAGSEIQQSSKGKDREGKKKLRVVPWPSQIYAVEDGKSRPGRCSDGAAGLRDYREMLQGALSRASSVAGGSMSPSPDSS